MIDSKIRDIMMLPSTVGSYSENASSRGLALHPIQNSYCLKEYRYGA